jgi:predicted DNA-binding protein with PD1-like motif
MRATQLSIGRTFGVVFDHGEDFFESLSAFCADEGIRSGYVPMFLGGFSQVQLVGSCEPIADPDAPVWSSVGVDCVEALGVATLAWDEAEDRLAPHVHLSVGLKGDAAHGRTSHLLGATVQFVSELMIVEVLDPVMTRPRQSQLYDVPLLTFGPATR